MDRSILEPDAFLTTDVHGTYVLLEAARERSDPALPAGQHRRGVRLGGARLLARERSAARRPTPYSASKAGADLLVLAYSHTHGLPVVITRCLEQLGPYQYPEKVIPLFVTNASTTSRCPSTATGMNVRDWLYVGGPLRGHRAGAAPAARRRGLQHRRRQRGREHRARRGRSCGSPASPRLDPAREGSPGSRPALLGRLEESSTSSAGRPAPVRRRSARRPSSGIVSTNPGGVRSSPASFARTTSGSTAAADCGCARCRPSRGWGPAGRGEPVIGNYWRSCMTRILTLVLATLLVIPSIAPGAPTSAPDRRLDPDEISAFPSFVRRVEPAIVGLRVRNAENSRHRRRGSAAAASAAP